jgi:uncharacterized protein (TIGR02757 family)
MKEKETATLKKFFDDKVKQYNQVSFIKDDPVCIPHLFSKPADIEIAGLFAAVFAWGNRTTIINKSKELMAMMDNSPHDFCLNHTARELQKLEVFKHRTFNATDLFYFIDFIKHHYTQHTSLETAFVFKKNSSGDERGIVEQALTHFHNYFFSLEHVSLRTKKHNHGVDFGIWKKIKPADLICPIDVHVARVAKRFDLLHRKQIDWQAAVELTGYLRTLDPQDPVKYDFALFGLGVMEKY